MNTWSVVTSLLYIAMMVYGVYLLYAELQNLKKIVEQHNTKEY